MSSFANTIMDFQRGACTFDHLEGLIERDIALGSTSANDMLSELDAVNSGTPLDDETYTGIRALIVSAETRRTQFGRRPNGPVDDNRTRISGSASQPSLASATGSLRSQFPIGPSSQTTAPQDRPPTIGDTINQRFVLEELIGSGGMSQVFKASDKRRLEAMSRDPFVALKVMRVQGLDPGEAFVAMQREVQKSQALTHPNILRVNDFDRDGSTVFTTMELLQGQSLRQVIAEAGEGKLPLDEALRIINEMSKALAYAHDNNIVHADFKPSNVFVTQSGQVKVIDFGIARGIQAPDTPEEDKTVFDPRALGALTPAYASPEMLEYLPTDRRDDIYAIGCVAYELVSGRHPFSKLKATDARDNGHDLRRPEGLNNNQWAAIEGALQFNRDDRIESVQEFLTLLNNAPRKALNWGPIAGAVAGLAVAAVGWWLLQSQSISDQLIVDCADCPPLLSIAPGSTQIGAQRSDITGMFEYPTHTVRIAKPFAMSTTEVSVGQYRAFVQATRRPATGGCRTSATNWRPDSTRGWQNPGFNQTEAHPVTCVSWQDATDYVQWLSTTTGQSYRLPSEAEWEYVAREHAELPVQFSPDSDCGGVNVADTSLGIAISNVTVANCNDGFAHTAPVNRDANEGFSDLRGNLFEWTADCWNPNYTGAPIDGRAWQRGDCQSRVLRGGSWFTAPQEQRLTYRNRYPADYRSNTFGLRIVRELADAT